MPDLFLAAAVNFLSVFIGLLALWSALSWFSRRQRALNAAFAGGFAALVGAARRSA